MPQIMGNPHNVTLGDEIEVYGYDGMYDGIQGTVVGMPRSGTNIAYLDVTQGTRRSGYKAGDKHIAMYIGNLRPVDNAASFIPEDWS